MARPIPQQAIDLIKQFEGLELDAYPDPATKGPPWTIGWGHTVGVSAGQSISAADADRLLLLDCSRAGVSIEQLVTTELNDNQFSALVSFVFNLGANALRHSTLLKLLNRANQIDAAKEFPKWDMAGGRAMPGLLRRRQAEQALFLKVSEETAST